MTYRVLLDLSHPHAPDLSELPDQWVDVTGELSELARKSEVRMFDVREEDVGVLAGPQEEGQDPSGFVHLMTGDPPPWAARPGIGSGDGGSATSQAGAIATSAEPAELQLVQALTWMRDEDAREYAKRLLEARLQGREAATELERGNVQHMQETIRGVRERVRHMETWRRIAKWGIGFFAATTIFAIWAVGYLITGPVNAGTMAGETLSLVIFTLAVFALSPATLLLLERPLKGLDSWSPGGSDANADSGDDAKAKAGEGQNAKGAKGDSSGGTSGDRTVDGADEKAERT